MTLRQKTLLIIGVTLLCLLLTLYLSLSTLWLNGFAEVESRQTYQNVERVTEALANDLIELNSTAGDWSAWDETHAFVEDGNDKYIQANLGDAAIANLRLNIMLFINKTGQIVYGKGLDLEKKVAVSIPNSLRQYISVNSRLVKHSQPNSSYTGIVLLPESPLLVASRPILKDDGALPIHGTLILGRFLSAAAIQKFAKLTHLQLAVYPLKSVQFKSEFQVIINEFRHEISNSQSKLSKPLILVRPLGNDRIAGYTLLRDIEGKPGLLLRVDTPRDIYQQGRQSLDYLVGSLLAVGLIFGIVTLLLLEKLVLSPLANFSAAVRRISTSGNLAERLLLHGRDELSHLGIAINQLLATLQKSQSQLIQSEKMSSLGQLVAGVAHEINNPISFVYGNINHATEYSKDLLHLIDCYQQHYPNPPVEIQAEIEAIDIEFLMEDLPKLMNSMKLGAERIREIVLSLRNFSRLDESELKAVDLHEGIDSTLLILQHRLKAKGNQSEIKIFKDYGNLPKVECYPGQLNQVFMNLLANAIDALEEKRIGNRSETHITSPCIQIHTEIKTVNSLLKRDYSSKWVVIRIADNGYGMSTAVLHRLFDPFYTTKPVGKGTGLGLSISYQIVVEKHKGQLLVNSELGQGTEFIIELPV